MPIPIPINILLVDDQPRNLIALEAALDDADYCVIAARSGADALGCVLEQDFAVIVLDIHMPDMDGFEAASLIRARERSESTPIIFLTADDRAGARVIEGYRLGAVDYLYKPFDPVILRSKVDVFVDLFRKTAALEQRTGELITTTEKLERRTGELIDTAALLKDREQHFRALIENAPDVVLIVAEDAIIRYASPSIARTLGYSREQIQGEVLMKFLHPDEVAAAHADLAVVLKTGAISSPISRRWRHVDGSYRTLESTATNLLRTPGVFGVVVNARDVTERDTAQGRVRALSAEIDRARAAEVLRHQALHDGLTGLPNRVLLYERLEGLIAGATGDGGQSALLVLDLDRFKQVNDTLGHQVGDSLLRQLGQRLQDAVQVTDLVARLGGDEFAMVLPHCDGGRATQVADDVARALHTPFTLDSQSITMEASIGIAVAPQHAQNADTLLRRADLAMHQAKRRGTGVEMYAENEDEHRPDRLALLGELRRAIEHDELLLHYQPMLDLRDGTIVGVEALVRWQHPQRGFLPPSEFLPLAELSGLIHPLTWWVLEAVVRQQRGWRALGMHFPVSVNLSRRMLHDVQLPQTVAQLLAQSEVPPSSLVLEITESSLMADPLGADQNLKQLRTLGVCMSIDDFGTGYSSLASLKNMVVDELKIDRSFVQAMATDASARAIVRAIVDLADALKLRVVAEGVEDRATWDLLVGLGCDVAQGYLLSPPVAPAELQEWMVTEAPLWLDSAGPRSEDPLRKRIRDRGARLTAEEEFIARKHAEAALLASEERNRLALQAARMGTWERDVALDLLTWSSETERLHGVEPGSFDGTTATMRLTIHPDDWPGFEAEMQASAADQRETLATFRTVWPDGSVHWIEARGRGIYANDGSQIRVSGTSTDITQRRLAEEALRASEERFRKQYKGVPLPTYSWLQTDDDFVLDDYNDAAEATVGVGIRDWLGIRASVRYVDEPGILADLQACALDQCTIRREVHYRYPDTGGERDLAVTYVFVPPKTVMIHTEDVTVARQAEQQRDAMAQSEKLRALGQMATGIAHDLNQSLMLVASYSDLARKALLDNPPDLAELEDLLTTTTQAAMDGGETVKRLLLFTRAAPKHDIQEVDLGSVVREAARLTAPRWRDAAQAEGRPISLHVEAEGQPCTQGSPSQLRELLTNLIFNAVDALPTGGTICLRVAAEDGHAIVEVTDSGTGMSAEVQARVFEPFFTTKGDDGTGLGLAMVFGIVERHGGHIEVQSTPGAGTTFRITLPLLETPMDSKRAMTGFVHAEAQRPLRVLVVDDEPMMTRAVARMLKPSGHLVSVAESGEEALEKLAEQAFDVVLSDMGMGAGMNGWELADAVRRRWPTSRFLLATGWGAAIDPAEALSRGVEGVLSKPYQVMDLLNALARTHQAA